MFPYGPKKAKTLQFQKKKVKLWTPDESNPKYLKITQKSIEHLCINKTKGSLLSKTIF